MQNLVSIREEDLIPKMLIELWPRLVYTNYSGSGIEDGVKPWYGFMYLDLARQPIGNQTNGPAILRLSEGSIYVIDQKDAWNSWIPTRKNYIKKIIEIPVSDPDFDKYRPIIDKSIKTWLSYYSKVKKSCQNQ